MNFKISNNLQTRCFAREGVTLREVEECFLNRKMNFNCADGIASEERNIWFIANTDRGRILRINFTHTTKLSHTLQLPDKVVIMEQQGTFYEIKDIKCLVHAHEEPGADHV